MIVQIVGSHPTASEAPLIPGAERWCITGGYRRLPGWQCEAVFDLHPSWQIDMAGPAYVWEEYAGLAGRGVRFVLLEPDPRLPQATVYPLADVQMQFAQDGRLETSFQSSLDYMMALAILTGATAIDLQGIDLRHQDEYIAQRETFRYWMGIARGRGIRVTVPEASGLDGACLLYGYMTETGRPGPPGEHIIVRNLRALLERNATAVA